jgi:hypothetical protein
MERFEDNTRDIENNTFLTLKDTADILGVTVNTIRDWTNTGKLPSSPIGPRGELQFRMEDIIAFVMEHSKGYAGGLKPKDEMNDDERRCKLEAEYIVSTFDAHADEAKAMGEMELIPYVYRYTELCSNPRPESRVREEDIRFLLTE